MAHRKSPARIAKDARVAHFRSLAAQKSTPAAAYHAMPWEAVAQLESRLVGRIVLPCSPDYDKAGLDSCRALS